MRHVNDHITAGSSGVNITLREFLLPLFRRKRVLIASFLIIFVGRILFSLFSGPSYASHMQVLVNRERLDPMVSTQATTQMIATDNPVTPEEINSEVELLRSRDVLEQVVIQNGLENPRGFSIVDALRPHEAKEDRIARAVKNLDKNIKIENIKESNLIEITYESHDPDVAYGVLKSLGDFYVAKHVTVHRPIGSYEFFAKETEQYHNELEDAVGKLRAFVEQNGVGAADEERTNLATQIASSIGLQHAAEQAIAFDESKIQSDKQQLISMPPRVITLQSTAANEKLIGDLTSALLTAQTKRTELAMKYDPSFPLVQEADREIAETKTAIANAEHAKYVTETTDQNPTYELLHEDIAKTEADLSAQRGALSATIRSIESIQNEMVNLKELSLSQQDLQREATAAENNYLLYLAKREQERTSNALDVTRIANVAIAVPPAIPVLPVSSWPLILLEALALALVLSVGLTYAVDYFDPTFHTPPQVLDILGIPIVVAIPKTRSV